MTIIGAINIKLGASAAGTAVRGKVESTKDLAKGFGMLCIFFNCSELIDFKIDEKIVLRIIATRSLELFGRVQAYTY